MDSSTGLKHTVGEVSWALTKFADEHHWPKSDYWIYYFENSEWDIVNFVLVSREFDDADEKASYQEVWRHLIAHFTGHPEILKHVTLLVRGKKKFDQGGVYGLGPDYKEFGPDYHEFWTIQPVAHLPATKD